MHPGLHAGTTGVLEGYVKDAKTGEILPGASVVIVELQQGTISERRSVD